MRSGAHAPTSDPKEGEIVAVNGRAAIFLYRRDMAATVRYCGERDPRVVPFAKLEWRPT